MATVPEDFIQALLGNVASALNFEEWKHSQLQFDSIGQNYFGILFPLVLIGKINGQEASIRLVLKLAPTDEKYRVSGAVTLMFAREIFMYSTVLYEYRSLQQGLKLSPLVVPTCHYMCSDYCREAIVLQDMTATGYKPCAYTMILDFNHISVSLKSLAMFHALSFLLRRKNAKVYEEATKVCVPLSLESNKRFMEILEDRLKKAIHSFEGTKYASIFEDLKRNLVTLVEAAWDSVEDTCICHGDMWKENILFKYENEEPVSACLIDYQTARVSSPAYDVLYLITSSTASDLRRTHFQNLLDMYYQHFEQVLQETGLKSHEVYSKKSFESDLKTVAPACVIIANTALWLASGCQQEGHVRSKRILNTEEERKAALENYKTIMKGVLDDFISFNLIQKCDC